MKSYSPLSRRTCLTPSIPFSHRSICVSRLSLQHLLLALVLAVYCVLSGCTATQDSQAAVPPEAEGADEFMIVDCLLPGQVRKLGGNFTYITQRRPIKTATSDCEIRGGDYVAYDRADYSTALRIWLPQAEQGDAIAQTYVGEIYEKGLGLAPDFQVAAHWYRKAAQQNHSRAQINLGHLYEKGLGVDQDQQQALNLYRLASGIRDDALLFASTLNATYVPREQFETQSVELRQQQRQVAKLQARIEQIDTELAERTQTLAKAENQLRDTELAISQLTEQAQAQPVAGPKTSERELALGRQLEALFGERELLQRQLADSQESNVQLQLRQQQLDDRMQVLDRTKAAYQQQQLDLEQQLQASREQLQRAESSVEGLRRQLQQQLQGSVDTASSERLALETELAAKNQALQAQRAELAALESSSGEKLAQLRTTLAELSDSQHATLMENQAYEEKLAATQNSLQQREQELAFTNQRLREAESALQVLNEGQSKASQQERALQQKIAMVEDSRAQLQQQLAGYSQQNQQLGAKQKALQASLSEAQAARAGYQQQLRELQQQLQTHQQRLQTSEQSLAKAEQRLHQERAKGARLTPTILALQDDLAAKNQQLIEEQQRLAQWQNSNSTTQKQLETEVAKLDRQQRQLAEENLAYQRQLADLDNTLASRETALEGLNQQLLLSRAELEVVRSQSAEALTELSAEHDRAMAEQRQQLAQLTERYQQQLTLVESQKREISTLQQQAQQVIQSLPATAAAAPAMQVAANDYPGIEIIEPPVVLTRSRAAVRVHRVQGERQVVGKVMAPAGLMSLSVNGEPHQVMDNNLFRTSVALSGDPTPVDVVVVDNKGRRAAVSFSFVAQGQKAAYRQSAGAPAQLDAGSDIALGDYYALIIGNNNYQHFSTLATAVNDARETERVLRFKYNFKTRLLLNADRYTILSSLNELRKTLKPEDNLLIYYAGHGKLDESNNRGYWLPVDAESDNTSNWISNTAITDILNVTEAKHILVVADSCYSGTLTQTPLARMETDIPQDVRQEWIKVMNETRARITLTSGGVEPVLDGGGGAHSVFAKAFIDALQSNRGILEGYSLYSEVLNRMSSSPAAAGQVPQYAPIHLAGHESGEFFFKPI